MPLSLLTRLIATACLMAGAAAADDAPFLNTDPASVLGKGDWAVQQWVNGAYGHSGESYGAFQSLTEIDYGLSNRVQISGTLAYSWDRTRPTGGSAINTSLVGFQGEVVFLLAATDKNPVGIALAVDPAFDPSGRGLALRLLLTKYTGGFEHVLNVNFESGWAKNDTGGWDESGAVTINYGLGYALDKHWTVALEMGNQFAFSRLVTSVNFEDAGVTFFAGPTVQYDCETAIVSFGVQTQLPLASGGGDITRGYRGDAERWRAALRITHSL